MKKLLILPAIMSLISGFAFAPLQVAAQDDPGATAACEQLKRIDPTASCGAGEAEEFIDTLFGQILNILFLVLGAVSVVMVVIGGFRYVLSGGNPENTKAAYNTILYAAIGLVVAIAAQAIIRFVISNLG